MARTSNKPLLAPLFFIFFCLLQVNKQVIGHRCHSVDSQRFFFQPGSLAWCLWLVTFFRPRRLKLVHLIHLPPKDGKLNRRDPHGPCGLVVWWFVDPFPNWTSVGLVVWSLRFFVFRKKTPRDPGKRWKVLRKMLRTHWRKAAIWIEGQFSKLL